MNRRWYFHFAFFVLLDDSELTQFYLLTQNANFWVSGAGHFLCNACGKIYKYRKGLVRHKRVECGNKEPQFGCPVCGRKFKHKYQLRPHLASVHTMQAVTYEPNNSFFY